MSKRFGTLFNSPLFKESVGNNEDEIKDEDEVGAEAEEATDNEFDASEVAGEDLSYLDDIDEDGEEEFEDEGDDVEEDDFEDEDYDDSEEDTGEEFDDEDDFDGEEDFSEDDEYGDDEFEGEEGAEVAGEAPQLTSNTYDSGKAEEEPKMFYPSEEEVTLEVIEETGNGAVGDEAAITAMDMETPEVESVEVGESQTELPEVPEEYDFEGVYNSEIEDFDNGFGANLETSTDDDMESDFDVEEDGDDFGTDEDEEFDAEDGDDEDFESDEDFGDEEEEFEDDEECDDVEAEGVDFDDDFESEEDDEDFDIDTEEDDFEDEE